MQECNSARVLSAHCKSAQCKNKSARTRMQDQECKSAVGASCLWHKCVQFQARGRPSSPLHSRNTKIQIHKNSKYKMATNGFWMDALNFKLSNIAQSNSKLFMSSFTFLLSAASLLLMILKCLVAIKFYVQLCIFAQTVCFWWSRNTFLAIRAPDTWHSCQARLFSSKGGKNVTRNAESTRLLQRIVGSLPQVTSAELNA